MDNMKTMHGCFVADCETLTRDRYCSRHAKRVAKWLQEEARLDALEDQRHPEVSSWDWADWDWDYSFDAPGFHGRHLGKGYRTVKRDEALR